MTSQRPGPAALYRFWDRKGSLLYVGITQNLEKRWYNHELRQPWWLDVATRKVTWLASYEQAVELEREALQRELPQFDRTIRGPEQMERFEKRLQVEGRAAARKLRADIASGVHPKGCVLPAPRELSAMYKLAIVGIMEGLSTLRYDDKIVTQVKTRWVVMNPRRFPARTVREHGAIYFWAWHYYAGSPFTVPELAERSGYSQAAVLKATRSLRTKGMAQLVRAGGRGRPPAAYRITKAPMRDSQYP